MPPERVARPSWSPAFSEAGAHYAFVNNGRLVVRITGDGLRHKWEVRQDAGLGDIVLAYGLIERDGNRSLRAAKLAAEEAFKAAGGE